MPLGMHASFFRINNSTWPTSRSSVVWIMLLASIVKDRGPTAGSDSAGRTVILFWLSIICWLAPPCCKASTGSLRCLFGHTAGLQMSFSSCEVLLHSASCTAHAYVGNFLRCWQNCSLHGAQAAERSLLLLCPATAAVHASEMHVQSRVNFMFRLLHDDAS